MRIKSHNIGSSGVLLIEILLAVALTGMIALIVMSSFIYGQESTAIAGDRSQAAQIANMSIEAVHNIAQDSYANLADYTNDTTYYLDISGSEWNLVTSPTVINDIFTPAISFSDGPGGSRQITAIVTWLDHRERPHSVTATTYLTDWQASVLLPSTANLLQAREEYV